MMNIGFANINLGVRGSTRRLVELSNHLIRRGHKVTVYLPDGITCDWLRLDAPIKKLSKMVGTNDFLIYFGHTELFDLMQKAKVKQRILYVLGMGNEKVLQEKVALNKREGVEIFTKEGAATLYYALHNQDTWKVFANCFSMANWIETNLQCRAWTVQGGIDHDTFHRIGKPVAYKVVGSGSKRTAEGTLELKKAFEMFKTRNKAIKTQLYAGFGYTQTRIAEIISSADIYLDAQKWGGWNNAVAEAMSIGCATVCTNIMGNRDFCINEENCLIVGVDDVKAMVDATIRLLEDGELRGKIAKSAEKDMRKYTWENAAIQMEKALENL